MSSLRHSAGFSLIEMILVVAMLSLLVSIGAPIFESFLVKNDLTLAGNALAVDLYRAQAQSRDASRDNSWGVHIQAGSITLFEGASYAARVTAFDEVYALAGTITTSGTTDYVFAKQTGLPDAAGSTTLTSTAGTVVTATVNAKGMVEH